MYMTMRIAILCNDRLALPAIAALLTSGTVVAVAMPARTSETRLLVQGLCAEHQIPFSVFRKKDFGLQLVNWLHSHQPDVVLVKTFPWKIPAAALSLPKHGFINFHYAPLPAWRGPNPLFWMILNRVSMAGVAVHRMDASYDTGPVLLQLPVPMQADMTMGVLGTQLAYAGVDATNFLLQGLAAGSLSAIPQDHTQAQWYRKPVAADLMIDWERMPAPTIQALVNACNPWNKGAATSWKGWRFGITDTTVLPASDATINNTVSAGTIVALDAVNGLQVACCDGQLIRADVIYCEEGFFTGHRLGLFGLKQYDQLGSYADAPVPVSVHEEVSLL
jgi:methionyl-tRNA formyltransferase